MLILRKSIPILLSMKRNIIILFHYSPLISNEFFCINSGAFPSIEVITSKLITISKVAFEEVNAVATNLNIYHKAKP
jgi:hypothetical protein